MLMGVFAESWVLPLAEVLDKLGSHHVMVVHSEDGMDEISISAPTHVAELRDNEINTYTICPEDFGLKTSDSKDIIVDNAEDSLKIMNAVLENKDGAARDIVILNAGAAIYTAGLTEDLAKGVERAKENIANGSAKQKLIELINFTNKLN